MAADRKRDSLGEHDHQLFCPLHRLPRGENLYQIKRGNNGISRDVAERIVAKFPEIDLLWLLTGNGQMFSGGRQLGTQIPFYRADAELQIMQTGKLRPECDLVIPMLADCDLAMLYTGRVMGHVTPCRDDRAA